MAGGQGERCLLRTEKMRSANRECHWLWRASKPIPEGVLEGAREYDRRYGGSAGWPWMCLGIKCAPHPTPDAVPGDCPAPHNVPAIAGTICRARPLTRTIYHVCHSRHYSRHDTVPALTSTSRSEQLPGVHWRLSLQAPVQSGLEPFRQRHARLPVSRHAPNPRNALKS